MSDEGGRLPGDLLRKVLEPVLTRRILHSVAIPALADLQHEAALTGTAPLWRRALVLARGYLGLWSALALCLASWPARSLREDWLAGNAPGPRLLRALTPRVGLLGLVLTFLLIAQSARTLHGTGGAWALWLLLPAVVTVTMPAAFLLGLVLALSRLAGARPTAPAATRWLSSVVGLSIASGLFTFALGGWVTPQVNQSYREHMLRVAGEPGLLPIAKAQRELTLGELQIRIRDGRKDGKSTVLLEVEWHKKWVIPAACFLFGPLAIGLHGLWKRPRPATAVTLAFAGTYLLYVALRAGEDAALAGWIPPLPAIWAGDAALAVVTSCLIARLPRLHEGTASVG